MLGKPPFPRFFYLHGFYLAGCLFLLTQCSTPHYPVQGISRSSQAYYVQGSWHYPQKYYDYDKIGLASWYGPGFHGSKKAQGEIYNQYAMTAAHKTLPLPSIARVTNIKNGKSIIVLIDDRGPFKYKGRIIDLSVTAAKELGLHDKGIGKVRVQSLPKESHALSIYLKHYGNKAGIDRKKRTWEDVYRQEIGWRPGYQNLTQTSSKVHNLNCQKINQQKKKTFKIQSVSNINHYIQSRTWPKHKGAHR